MVVGLIGHSLESSAQDTLVNERSHKAAALDDPELPDVMHLSFTPTVTVSVKSL